MIAEELTEALLDRFNQILAGLSLEDARNRESSPAPRRVLIAHDAKAIGVRDLQLLSRLVQDFPGANVSLVLLLDRTGIAQHEKNLDAFGQRLLRWPLEQPTRAEGESLLNVARGMGFEVEEPSTDNAPATNSSTAGFAGGAQAHAPETVSPSATPSATATDPKRPTLTIVK